MNKFYIDPELSNKVAKYLEDHIDDLSNYIAKLPQIVYCYDCIHRPIAIDEYNVTIPWHKDEQQLDLTCPYVRLDNCDMPEDNFYCVFGEK